MTDSEPSSFLSDLDVFLRGRRSDQPEGSYSARLVTDPAFAQRKLMEEAFEVCLELQAGEIDKAATAEEAADLVFHLLAALVGAGVAWEDVEAVLRDRHGRPARHSTYASETAEQAAVPPAPTTAASEVHP
ncbi:MAG: phosphoribosyl-ATP diphosphatase [Acidimicrobiales bacterium]|nr:phosphoribosyl-ATP diphosphatase [Acidimicrobiales bacterium]